MSEWNVGVVPHGRSRVSYLASHSDQVTKVAKATRSLPLSVLTSSARSFA